MSLAPGSRLGPYEVVAPLGAGGMGEVYKARDSRLNRSVAIKLLSSEVASDPDRRKRFLREAQAVAALSHPHIGATGHRWPHFLPDGDHFLYLAFAGQDTPRSTLRVDSLSRPGGTSLLGGATEGQYADGLLFFVQSDVLLAQPFDPDRRTLHGDVRSVAPPPASLHTGRFAFSVAADGTLVYRLALDEIQRAQLTWFAPDGRRLATIGDVDAYVTPRISPDQRRIAAGRLEGRTSDIWILEGPARIFSRLTTTPRRESLPVWSPDSQRLAVAADLGHGGGVELQIIPTGAAEAPGAFHTSTFTLRPVAWSGDGRILFQRIDQRDRVNLLTMAPQAGAEPLVFRADTYNYVQAAISPDGRHVAYASDLSGRFEVYVEDYPTPGNRRPVSHGGGTQPRWHPDGRVLYYLSPDHYLTAVRVNGVPPTYSEPRPLFALLMPEGNFRLQGANYDVAADGRILAAVLQEQAAEPRTATVWLGATATLRQ